GWERIKKSWEIGPSGHRAIESSQEGKIGASEERSIGPAEQRRIGASGDRAIAPLEQQIPRVARNDKPGAVEVAAGDQESERAKPKRRRRVKTCEYLRLDGTVCCARAESNGF